MTTKYQLRFARNGSCSYEYADATPETALTAACERANEWLARQRGRAGSMFDTFRPIRTVRVVEYDNTTKAPKRNGHKFKLKLQFTELRFAGGGRQRNEWYEPEGK